MHVSSSLSSGLAAAAPLPGRLQVLTWPAEQPSVRDLCARVLCALTRFAACQDGVLGEIKPARRVRVDECRLMDASAPRPLARCLTGRLPGPAAASEPVLAALPGGICRPLRRRRRRPRWTASGSRCSASSPRATPWTCAVAPHSAAVSALSRGRQPGLMVCLLLADAACRRQSPTGTAARLRPRCRSGSFDRRSARGQRPTQRPTTGGPDISPPAPSLLETRWKSGRPAPLSRHTCRRASSTRMSGRRSTSRRRARAYECVSAGPTGVHLRHLLFSEIVYHLQGPVFAHHGQVAVVGREGKCVDALV